MTVMGALEHFSVDGIAVQVRRNARRRSRIGMVVDPSGVVVLDAPLSATDADVHSAVADHKLWLRHRIDQARTSGAQSGLLRYVDGEILHFMGDALELRVCSDLFGGVDRVANHLVVRTPDTGADAVRSLVRAWYVRQGAPEFVSVLQSFLWLPWVDGAMPRWRQRFMRSQWGSCSATGVISLNTHLAKTPRRLIEFVVLHELCHLKYRNHGTRFHGLMDRHMPDWRARSSELDRYVPLLVSDG